MKYLLVVLTLIIALVGVAMGVSGDVRARKNHKARNKVILAVLLSVLLVGSAGLQIFLQCRADQKEWQAKWSGQLRSPVRSDANILS